MPVQLPDLHPGSDKWYYLEIPQINLGAGISIENETWIVPPELLQSFSFRSGLVVGAKIANNGGSVGYTYPLVCRLTTSDNQILNIECRIEISLEGN